MSIADILLIFVALTAMSYLVAVFIILVCVIIYHWKWAND